MPLTLPLQAPIFKQSDLDDPNLTLFNQWMTAIAQALNNQSGQAGPVKLGAPLDLNGNNITNTGAPTSPKDVVTLEYAMKTFGAAAIQPQLEATSQTPLQTYRQLNSRQQRELFSTFLQGAMNTVPTSNTATLSAMNSGGNVIVTVSAGMLQHVDGSQYPFATRTDTIPLATSFSITSLTRTSGVVTAVLGSSFTGTVGQQIQVTGPIASEWQGIVTVGTPISGSTIVYAQPGPNDSTGSGGIVTFINTYYYTISRGQANLELIQVGSADTWSNRVGASFDGTTIVAVAIITSAGLDPINSAGGGTLPVTGAAIPVIRRL